MTKGCSFTAMSKSDFARLDSKKQELSHDLSGSLFAFKRNSAKCVNLMKSQHDPGPILQTAFGFWSSKVLLTAIEFGLFTKLADRRLTAFQLGSELALHPRGTFDFFDALVAMKFLERDGDGP